MFSAGGSYERFIGRWSRELAPALVAFANALTPSAASQDEAHMPLCRQRELCSLWDAHGLREVEERPLVVDMRYASFEDYWEPFLHGQGPAGAYTAALSTPERQNLEVALRRRLPPHGAFTLSARAWAVRGVVP